MKSIIATLRCDFRFLFEWLRLILLCTTKAHWTIKEIFGDVELSRLPYDYFSSLNLRTKWTKKQQKACKNSINSIPWLRLLNFPAEVLFYLISNISSHLPYLVLWEQSFYFHIKNLNWQSKKKKLLHKI